SASTASRRSSTAWRTSATSWSTTSASSPSSDRDRRAPSRMYALHSWLAEYVPGLDVDPFELVDLLSSIGLCCEEVQLLGQGLDGVVVAKVLELSPHPDADRIQLVQVDAGDGEPLQICCGAFNMSVGDLVPLATIGTTMPNGLEISRRKLRGEWSNGMLCSPPEVNLPGDPSGILLLPEGLEPGVPLTE